MRKRFFITTPIYYSNDIPHIGHAYSSLIADTIARSKRLLGYDVKFSTGVDENSQKIVEKAQEAKKNVYDYLDQYAEKHKAVRDYLHISYTDFIRTTQKNHTELVQRILQQTYDKGDIYKGKYVGYYCVGCEGFKKKSDLIEGSSMLDDTTTGKICPLHPNKILQYISEENYFFSLERYQRFLENFYEQHKNFIIPQSRSHEIRSLIKEGVEDFSISRETTTFGIPLPFDSDQVTYVRYDALLNYITVCQRDGFWADDTTIYHVLGKDIARFHAIYRPAMLHSVNLPLPTHEIITGYFTIDGQKMSKSLGNVIDPVSLVENYGRDALVFYLFYDIAIGKDGDFSRDRFHDVYSQMLLGGWGNLISRVATLAKSLGLTIVDIGQQTFLMFLKQYEGFVVEDENKTNAFMEAFESGNINQCIDQYVSNAGLQQYARDRYQLVQGANKFIDYHKPRELIKNNPQQAESIISFLLYIIKQLALISSPMLTESVKKTASILGINELSNIDTISTSNICMELWGKKSFVVSPKKGYVYQPVQKKT